MGDFTKLGVWRKSHELTLNVYRETSRWPDHERFGLIAQARRASASIPSNIAEGCGRNSDPELTRFARMSLGSASELSYLFILAHDLGYLGGRQGDVLQDSVSEVRRMLTGLVATTSRGASPRTHRR